MNSKCPTLEQSAPETFRFYRNAIDALQSADVPFLVGGAYAFGQYTGISRHTKDFDIFVRPTDARAALRTLSAAGYHSEVVFEHWLGKAYHLEDFVDVIFSSGNGQCPVDGAWFKHAAAAEVLGADVKLVPAEEMIWQKAYIMERERFDGADVAHLLRARGRHLDWDRLLTRFGPHWRILLSHLVLFGFVYPDDHDSVPGWVLRALTSRVHEEPTPPQATPLCQGPLLSRTQYLADTEEWGYADPRVAPVGKMTEEQVEAWTDAGR